MPIDSPEISLVIPAYNEEKRIRPSLEEVARFCSKFGRETEVLIVDDGSRDNTAHLVRDFIATHPEGARFELLHYDKNRGKGFAVAQGLRKSRGKFVAFSDTDLSAPIDQLPLLIQGLESGADIAIASRRLPASKVVGLPYSRQLMGKFFALLSRLLVLPGFSDTQCGFKAYRREIAYKLAELQKIDGYTFDVEHLLLARRMSLRVVEIPVTWIFSEGSQINGIRDSLKMLRDLMAIPGLHPDKPDSDN